MTLLSSRRIHTGRVLNLELDTVQFPDGSTGELEMVRHSGAAAVVPFLDSVLAPDPLVMLLRQFRHAADGYVWEVPAGRLDPGEAPEACARRELEEEAGIVATELVHLTTIFTTPGFTDERIHLFLAEAARPGRQQREPDEFMEVHQIPWSGVIGMVREGEIRDAKTLVTLLYVEKFMRKP